MSLLSVLKAEGDKLVKEISKASGKKGPNSGIKGNPGDYPWQNNKDSFFPAIDIEKERADKIFPYKLLVINVNDNNKIVGGDTNQDSFVLQASDSGGLQFTFENKNTWEFTLPITPQQLSITDQYAINTTATMRGVVEEHNGLKFKIIQASGTTGIWPTRVSFEDPTPQERSGSFGFGGLFGGTIESLGNLSSALSNFEGKSKPESFYKESEDGQNTGYYQAILLQQFLEQYAMQKKNPANKGWRLVFHCPKTNESFVVTPMQYNVTRSQKAPQEFMYNMQFKAWKRINLKSPALVDEDRSKSIINPLQPTFLANLSNKLDAARSIMSASLNVVKAVRADFRKPFDQLRKVTLLAKDFAGVAVALSDLPNQINKDITSASKKRAKDLILATGGTPPGGSSVSAQSQQKLIKTFNDIKNEDDKNEGQSNDAINAGNGGRGARDAQKTSPLNNVFNEPEGNFDFFNSINVDELSLTPQQKIKIEDEIEINNLISIEEVKEIIADTQNLILDLSNNFGAGDVFYSQITGRPAPKERAVPMTIEEFQLISTLEEAVLQMNILVATRDFDDVRTQSPLEYVGGLAEDSGIEFNSTSPSKYLAPVPFGLDMQEISARYLGNPDRYNEIITLNNLRSPYIDEDGFFYDLLSNGDGRQLNISENKNLYIGQKIQLSSSTVPMFTRKISAIEKITDTNYLITVDGISDLGKLKASENAKIKAFLPGTVNSQNQIYIPSDEVVNVEPRTFDIPFLEDDPLTGLSKVDWLLTDKGDVVLNSFGEVALANGLTNIVQSLRTKVRTQKGQLLEDTSFGLGLNAGINVTDISIEQIAVDIRDMVLQDSRFEAVDKIEIKLLPPTLSLSISARLANGRGIFPINFNISI